MPERPYRGLRIRDDLGSLPLPEESLWIRPPRGNTPLYAVGLIVAAVVFVAAVAVPLASGLRERERESVNGMTASGSGSVTSTPQVTGDAPAILQCTGKLSGGRLVAAFVSTAAAVADWTENVGLPDAPSGTSPWRSYPPMARAFVCYFDGQFPTTRPAPSPGGPDSAVPNRALIFIDEQGKAVPPAKFGFSDSMPLTRPGGRF